MDVSVCVCFCRDVMNSVKLRFKNAYVICKINVILENLITCVKCLLKKLKKCVFITQNCSTMETGRGLREQNVKVMNIKYVAKP